MPSKHVRTLLRNSGLLVLSAYLTAFTAPMKDDLIELKASLNARSEAKFRDMDSNKVYILKTGTRGMIKEVKRFETGNYGICIQIQNVQDLGPEQKCVWVHYRPENPNMNLYSVAKDDKARLQQMEAWAKDGKQVSLQKIGSPDQATAAETTREIAALAPKSVPTKLPTVTITVQKPAAKSVDKPVASKPVEVLKTDKSRSDNDKAANAFAGADAQTAVAVLNQSQAAVSKIGSGCAACDIASSGAADFFIRAATTRKMAPRCAFLMDDNGKMGEYGKSVFNIMSEDQYRPQFTKQNALGSYCPKFNSLSDTQKLQAWTWFWTALAQEEASCIVNAHHGTTYTTKSGETRILNPREGYGLWAMERDRNVRRSRGAACDSIGTVAGQARCSIDIMVKRQLAIGEAASSKGGYWGPIRRESKDHQLMPHMRRLSLCF